MKLAGRGSSTSDGVAVIRGVRGGPWETLWGSCPNPSSNSMSARMRHSGTYLTLPKTAIVGCMGWLEYIATHILGLTGTVPQPPYPPLLGLHLSLSSHQQSCEMYFHAL